MADKRAMSKKFYQAIGKMGRCKRCGKRWCGTSLKLDALYPEDAPHTYEVTYGSMKCRRKGPKR